MQKQHNRLEQLVSVRGLAAWLVVFYHSIALLQAALPQLPRPILVLIAQGYLAVDFFFVLSGFIIFINYHAQFVSNFRQNALTFYWNRIARIYPVHAVMLVAYLGLILAFLYASSSRTIPDGYTTAAFLQSLLLLHGWTGNPTWWNVPSWSISAEWFIYLLFPFIALFFHRFLRGFSWHLALLAATIFGLYSVYAIQGFDSLGAATFRMALVRVFFEFLLGAIAGSLYVHHRAFLINQRVLTGTAAVSMCMVIALTNIPNYATVPLLFFLVVSYLSVDTSALSKLLSCKPLVYLGEISYSTYMVHYLVYDVFKAGWVSADYQVKAWQLFASFLCVLLFSVLMHKTIELPAQQFLRTGLFKYVATLGIFRNRARTIDD